MHRPLCRRLASTIAKRDFRATATPRPGRLGPPSPLESQDGGASAHGTVSLVNNPLSRCQRQQTRGKKTKTIVSLADLPQGPIKPLEPPLPSVQEEQDEGPAYPTVVLQARRNMAKFENCVLLTRVGGFYELYFEHAEEYGPLLNLKVASKKTNAGPVPMVGLPLSLVRLGILSVPELHT